MPDRIRSIGGTATHAQRRARRLAFGILLAALTVLVVVAIFNLFGNVGKIFNEWATWTGWSKTVSDF